MYHILTANKYKDIDKKKDRLTIQTNDLLTIIAIAKQNKNNYLILKHVTRIVINKCISHAIRRFGVDKSLAR